MRCSPGRSRHRSREGRTASSSSTASPARPTRCGAWPRRWPTPASPSSCPCCRATARSVEDLEPRRFADWLDAAEARLRRPGRPGRRRDRRGPVDGRHPHRRAGRQPPRDRRRRVHQPVHRPAPTRTCSAALRSWPTAGADPGARHRLRHRRPRIARAGLRRDAAARPAVAHRGRPTSCTARLGDIRCPILVFTSPQDHVVPPASSDMLAAEAGRTRRAGHARAQLPRGHPRLRQGRDRAANRRVRQQARPLAGERAQPRRRPRGSRPRSGRWPGPPPAARAGSPGPAPPARRAPRGARRSGRTPPRPACGGRTVGGSARPGGPSGAPSHLSPHAHMAASTGKKSRPLSVSTYSWRSGRSW